MNVFKKKLVIMTCLLGLPAYMHPMLSRVVCSRGRVRSNIKIGQMYCNNKNVVDNKQFATAPKTAADVLGTFDPNKRYTIKQLLSRHIAWNEQIPEEKVVSVEWSVVEKA